MLISRIQTQIVNKTGIYLVWGKADNNQNNERITSS